MSSGSGALTEVSESSSLRRSVVDGSVDGDCLEMTLDDGCYRSADWLDDVDTACDALPPPPALKNGVKKEVKFCLDVSDDDGLKRPLNVYQTLPETVLFRVSSCCEIG